MKNYLTISLYHPRVLRGGAQNVAKDLHDCADADPDYNATLLAGIDSAMFSTYDKVGAAITKLSETENEFILLGKNFDDFFHIVSDSRRDKAIRYFLDEVAPDVVHVHHSLWIGLDILPLIKQHNPNTKIIYTLHEYIPICNMRGQLFRYYENSICFDTRPDQCQKCFPNYKEDDFFLRKRIFQHFFEYVDVFVSPSEYLRQRFIDWGLPAEKIKTIKNGHKPNRPAGYVPKASKKKNVFGYFGQYVDVKGIDLLIEAAAIAAKNTEEEIFLNIYGGNKEYATPDYIAKIERLLSQAPANLKVTDHGSYSREFVFQLMQQVDWVVTPSKWPETFGLVVSEAWDAGRPVIASAAGGLTERIDEEVNGLSFTPGSAASLAEVISKCVDNSRLWSRISKSIPGEISLQSAWNAHKNLVSSI